MVETQVISWGYYCLSIFLTVFFPHVCFLLYLLWEGFPQEPDDPWLSVHTSWRLFVWRGGSSLGGVQIRVQRPSSLHPFIPPGSGYVLFPYQGSVIQAPASEFWWWVSGCTSILETEQGKVEGLMLHHVKSRLSPNYPMFTLCLAPVLWWIHLSSWIWFLFG